MVNAPMKNLDVPRIVDGASRILRECGVEKVLPPRFRLFVPNMSTAMCYHSSPLHIAILLAQRKIYEFSGMETSFGELLMVTSKVPDQQAAMEKIAGCLLGRTYGFTTLEGAGGLWMDEIFSPQQLILDIEIMWKLSAQISTMLKAMSSRWSRRESGRVIFFPRTPLLKSTRISYGNQGFLICESGRHSKETI